MNKLLLRCYSFHNKSKSGAAACFSALILPFISMILLVSGACMREPDYQELSNRITRFWLEKHNNFKDSSDAWGNYTLNLTFEAMLESAESDPTQDPIRTVLYAMRLRNYSPSDTLDYRSEPFCSIAFPLYEATGNSDWLKGFVYSSRKMREELERSPSGAVYFYAPRHEHPCLLIDFIQEYCLRMARTGYITGDSAFYRECADQFTLHARLLRDQKTGLWSQGKGWLEDADALSPGAWSRGHGWLMRGMVLSLKYLPPGSVYFHKVKNLMESTLQTLLRVQTTDGMWPVLLNRDKDATYPESSGTGMIAGYASMALREGFISEDMEDEVKKMVESAALALTNYVSDKGEIGNTCEGPGPLYSEDKYLEEEPYKGNEHGYQAFIHAFAQYHRQSQ